MPNSEELKMSGFHPADFRWTAALLRGESGETVARATLSNNINIIIAALDIAARLRPADAGEAVAWQARCMPPVPEIDRDWFEIDRKDYGKDTVLYDYRALFEHHPAPTATDTPERDVTAEALSEARGVIIGFAVDFMAEPAKHSTVLKIDNALAVINQSLEEDEWDGLDCACGGGWKVGHATGCPEATAADTGGLVERLLNDLFGADGSRLRHVGTRGWYEKMLTEHFAAALALLQADLSDALRRATENLERAVASDQQLAAAHECTATQNELIGQVWVLLGGQDMTREGGQNLVGRVGEMAAALAAAREQIAELGRERDEWATKGQMMADAAGSWMGRAETAEAALSSAQETIRACRKQVAAIIDDGTPTDFKAWLADLDAALTLAKEEKRDA